LQSTCFSLILMYLLRILILLFYCADNTVDQAFSDRNQESSSSRLDAIFRTLRSTRQGNRFNIWLDENHPRGGSAAPAVPQGLEDLIISQLRQPTPEQPSDPNAPTIQPEGIEDPSNLQGSEPGTRDQAQAGLSEATENATETAPSEGASLQGDSLNVSEQATDMQYERSDAASTRDRDGEAISQASSESGATIGESLRSLEVEIGSIEGHDDSVRRLPGGGAVPSTGLERVSEIPQSTSEEGTRTDSGPQDGQQASNRNGESDSSIDPTFLEALPEELRAEVLSSQQNQAGAQGSSGEQAQQDDGEIDPEFLAALPQDIREEVLAQQRAQRLQQSQELEGQPVEMDPVSIIATFPSEIREEVG
jgi:E3 ubiquitin-protein ligase HUWE1